MRRAIVILALAMPLWAATPEQAKQMIVMVQAKIGESDVIGSGIIAGMQNGRIYIATANHVVRRGAETAQDIQVRFRWLPGESHAATLQTHFDADLDLAVLAVLDADRLVPKERLPLELLAPAGSVKIGDATFLIGNPNGAEWDLNDSPEKISGMPGFRLLFRPKFIAPGHSGGGLFNERYELIGMLRSDHPPQAQAVRIEMIVNALRDPSWNYPVQLVEAPSGIRRILAPSSSSVPSNVPDSRAAKPQSPQARLEPSSDWRDAVLRRFFDSVASLPGDKVNVALSVGPSLTPADTDAFRMMPEVLADRGAKIVLLHTTSESDLLKATSSGRLQVVSEERPVLKGIDTVIAIGYSKQSNPLVTALAIDALRQWVDFYSFPLGEELWDSTTAGGGESTDGPRAFGGDRMPTMLTLMLAGSALKRDVRRVNQ